MLTVSRRGNSVENDHSAELSTIWDEARSCIEQGDYSKAIEVYKYILLRYANEKVAVEYASAYLGDIYLTLDKPDLAITYIEKAIGLSPEKPTYRYQLGFVYSKLKQWKKAASEFRKALSQEPHNAEYLRGLGWAIYNEGDQIKGLTHLRKANELEPGNINILNDLSVAYLGVPDLKNAKIYNELALKIDRDDSLATSILKQINHLKKHRLLNME